MNDTSLDKFHQMPMLTEEVGELDLDGYRITVIDKPNGDGKTFRFDIRITKLVPAQRRSLTSEEISRGLKDVVENVVPKMFEYDQANGWLRGNAPARFADEPKKKPAPKRKAARPKGKAK